ncbi:MAG: hypothetical protein LVQ97_01745 [Candidatus Micrarchaeales archaeon]|jgi:carbamate kinase|uniref:Carbamate kinase n=1 Tax=Candidatus Micrarchaeum acidiphilum ARMAN-2 TaxID=425595 RepID=C7DI66_MICA2|nr:MAG: Carbamate kinase [Candidatus Micrarchaeum acidiphilum ARMAN-2]MCW6160889.1 hypothetical protein [Candidatus Micrarchaeales archaeon]
MGIDVLALGGNAILKENEPRTFENQNSNVKATSKSIAELLSSGILESALVTHGNGPQVGDEILKNEYASAEVPRLPMDAINAETEGFIGSLIVRSLNSEFKARGMKKEAVCVLTHTIVDRRDPAFEKPTKPVGPFYSYSELEKELRIERFEYAKFGNSYRKVVSSPKPVGIVELEAIKSLLKEGFVVVAGGGGGVPVYRSGNEYIGIACVIDKDATSGLLASAVGAESLNILTDVNYVYKNIKDPKSAIKNATVATMEKLIPSLQEGNIRPKVMACVDFVKRGGKVAKVGNLDRIEDVLNGKNCTVIRA